MGSSEQAELVEKIKKHLVREFGDAGMESMRKLFERYDRDGDRKISGDELQRLLEDAGVGNSLTRGAWVRGVIGALDRNADRKIDWDEFVAAVK